jgi:hypothetical protein
MAERTKPITGPGTRGDMGTHPHRRTKQSPCAQDHMAIWEPALAEGRFNKQMSTRSIEGILG